MATAPSLATTGGDTPPPSTWSIFADTLAAILAAPQHGHTPLTRLDNLREREADMLYPSDIQSPYPLVHREQLRRLVKSWETPGKYTTLNRDDMERIYRYFQLNQDERLWLDAALITTFMERMIKDRLDNGSGLPASYIAARRAHTLAERFYPLILAELRQVRDNIDTWFDQDFRSAGEANHMGDPMNLPDDEAIDRALEVALDMIDRATLALTMSYQIAPHAEQIERARAAEHAFRGALIALDEIDVREIRSSEPWRVWQAEAQRGLAEAQERLADLGG